MEKGGQDWFEQCILPDNTELQEHTLKTDRIIVIGDRCKIDYGLEGNEIVVCEFSTINGDIRAGGDVRIDNFCEVQGDVYATEDAYLGEGVKIRGRLIVNGDLDIGDNVQIEKGFEAKGWISIRNPLPVLTYIVLYLVTLLGIEKEEEISEIMQKLFGYDEHEAAEMPLMIPSNSVLDMETFAVPKSMTIGADCRLHGNIRAGSVTVDTGNTIFGSLRAEGDITLAPNNDIHGNIYSAGNVVICEGVHVLGDVQCSNLTLNEEARLDGTIKAPLGVRIVREKC
ncbi:polymer-forming cytoskeletal protein [Methanogenium organophilum]|uniref:Polymer-forming cytoskeletal protein n=1 Tax=Methanogenium organophilum TaxID=2199 RepID=A0A9X9T7F9_METOG|nr:polymer-forming cytoskeletal protein [Methanogenium organophilum]WAI01328.1 polymer-forming cytoskeletal protein [Methanogenium organophilum]